MDRQAWDERYTGEALLWSAEPNRFLIGEVDGLEPGRALDLACGEGRNAVWLAQHGWEVTGVDFSAVALQKARGLTETRRVDVSWVLADVVEYVPTPAGYDLVLVFYLHLPADQRRRAFARAATAVDPGGTLLIVGHDMTNLTAGWGGPRDTAVLYTPDDVIGDIGDLEVIKAGRVERQVTTSDGPRTAIDLLVRATRPV
jgi:SAM-dependent methyltransferase